MQLWLPHLSQLNLCDFYSWSMLLEKVNSNNPPTEDDMSKHLENSIVSFNV
jgi:hypothetical protein